MKGYNEHVTKSLIISINSFGYHLSGIPKGDFQHGGGFVFDCRGLPNPGREDRFQDKTGQDEEVIQYLEQFPVVHDFLEHAFRLIEMTAQNYQERQFDSLMASFGCTGGQHRSVYCAESLAKTLLNAGYNITLKHFDKVKLL